MQKLVEEAARLGIALSEKQIEQFEVYYRELTDWNRRMNLTSITGREDVRLSHFLDSLTVVPALGQGKDPRVIDIGTGAGFPGLPVKIAFPEINLTLLEATAKKTAFLKHIVYLLCLENVEIITGRAEEIAHREEHREKYDMALSRAVAPLAALAELTLPFCKPGGRVIAQKKGDIEKEIARAQKAVQILGGTLSEIRQIELSEFPDRRCLVVIEKTGLSRKFSPPSRYTDEAAARLTSG